MDKHLDQVMHLRLAREAEVVLGQRRVDMLGQVRVVPQMLAREIHILVAPAARGHHRQLLLLRHRQVPRAKRVGEQFVHVEISRRAAAIPVFQLPQFDAQRPRRFQR